VSRHPAARLAGAGRSAPGRWTRSQVRASDGEREQAVWALREHFADGRLERDELERRVELAYRAGTRERLRELLSDLPAAHGSRMARRFYRFQRELLPYHAGAYVSINGALSAIWAATGEGRYWPAGVLAPTTVLIVSHAFGSRWLRLRLRLRRGPRR
jgi:Domain of unknown function (DUF1707)